MPPLARLTRRAEFLRTASARRKWVTPGVIVQARARQPGEALAAGGNEDAQVRVGLTVLGVLIMTYPMLLAKTAGIAVFVAVFVGEKVVSRGLELPFARGVRQ